MSMMHTPDGASNRANAPRRVGESPRRPRQSLTRFPPFLRRTTHRDRRTFKRDHEARQIGGPTMRSRNLVSSAVAVLVVVAAGIALTAARRSDRVERTDFHTVVTATTPAYD